LKNNKKDDKTSIYLINHSPLQDEAENEMAARTDQIDPQDRTLIYGFGCLVPGVDVQVKLIGVWMGMCNGREDPSLNSR